MDGALGQLQHSDVVLLKAIARTPIIYEPQMQNPKSYEPQIKELSKGAPGWVPRALDLGDLCLRVKTAATRRWHRGERPLLRHRGSAAIAATTG